VKTVAKFKRFSSLPITQAEYKQLTPRTKVGMTDDEAKSFIVQVYLSGEEIKSLGYSIEATDHMVASEELKWPSDIDAIIADFRKKKHMRRPMGAMIFGFIGYYPSGLDEIPKTPYNSRLVRIITEENGGKIFYEAQRPEDPKLAEKEMEEKIKKAMEEVPKCEPFTEKDLKQKLDMPASKSRVHLD
jgi:hypothetical protein